MDPDTLFPNRLDEVKPVWQAPLFLLRLDGCMIELKFAWAISILTEIRSFDSSEWSGR